MNKEEIREVLRKFCDLMFEKDEKVQSVNIKVELKNKKKIKFKKFREY